MRAKHWWQETSVIDNLLENPTSYDFIQATRLLRHIPKNNRQWSTYFHFSSSVNLNFPLNEIESLHLENEQIHLTNLVVGLTGMQGVLPYSYTNKIKLSNRQQCVETIQFLNLFNNKLTSQYVDATLNYDLPLRYEIEDENSYLNIIHALSGYVKNQYQQPELDDYFAEFSGLMQGQTNTVYALKTMLGCIFKTSFEIREFLPEKFKLEPKQQTYLGGSHSLGADTFCGQTIRQITEKIEIVIGPLNYQEYSSFLPHHMMSEKLKKMLKTWCSPTLMIDIRLILKKEEITPMSLCENKKYGLSQGVFLQPNLTVNNDETCYTLMGNIND